MGVLKCLVLRLLWKQRDVNVLGQPMSDCQACYASETVIGSAALLPANQLGKVSHYSADGKVAP